LIDLRSDTVTKPDAGMRDAMFNAPVGDDVYGEDPTVNALEVMAASLTGKEAALFVSSGTQSNLLALLSHCGRGDEYIAGQDAHAYRFEAGGAAVLGGIQPQPLAFNERGEMDLSEIEGAIKPDDFHFAKTRLLCLENTQGGKVLAMDYVSEFASLADEYGLKKHLDGARVFNASVKLSISIKEICDYFNTISICLSKGLAAPVGSVLVGDQVTIDSARRSRKMLGGGMRQAGSLAAAGIYALENNVSRLAEDHENASLLADNLQNLAGFNIKEAPQTNMVMLDLAPGDFSKLKVMLTDHDVTVSGQRWVCHKDISTDDIHKIINICREFSKT
jgi:threonine aldolase